MRKPKSIVHLKGYLATSSSLYRLGVADKLRAILKKAPRLLVPTHYSPYEPKRIRLSINDGESYSRALQSGSETGVSFTLLYRGRVHGELWVRGSKPGQKKRNNRLATRTQNEIWLTLENGGVVKNGLLEAFCDFYAQLVSISDPYIAQISLSSDFKNGDTYMDCQPEPVEYNGAGIVGHSVARPELACLPNSFAWQTYFGPEYVEPIGLENLLALDLYKTWPGHRGGVWLQLTERPEQMHIPEVIEEVTGKIRELEKTGVPDVAPEIDFSELYDTPDS